MKPDYYCDLVDAMWAGNQDQLDTSDEGGDKAEVEVV